MVALGAHTSILVSMSRKKSKRGSVHSAATEYHDLPPMPKGVCEGIPNLAFKPPSVRMCFSRACQLSALQKMNDGEFEQLAAAEVEDLCEVLGQDEAGLVGLDTVRLLLMTAIEPHCTEKEVQVLLRPLLSEDQAITEAKVSATDLHKAMTEGPALQTFLQLRSLPHAAEIDRNHFVESLVCITDKHDAFMTLPVNLLYIVVFVFIVSCHLQIPKRQQMESAIKAYVNGRDPLAEFGDNVDNMESFWDWLLDVESNGAGLEGPLGIKEKSTVDGSWEQYWLASRSVLIGDLHMRVRCFNGTEWSAWLLHSERGRQHLEANSGDHLGAAKVAAAHLRDSGWDSPDIDNIWVSFCSIGEHGEMFARTVLHVYLGTAGDVLPRITTEALPIQPYQDAYHYFAWDALYAIIILYVLITELTSMCSMLLLGCGELWDYFGFWNVVDWVSILLGLLTSVIWAVYCLELRDLRSTIPMTAEGKLDIDVMALDVEMLDAFMIELQTLQNILFALHVIMATNTLSIIATFFKAFTSNQRLKVVMDTFKSAAHDFAHFGIIFATIFLPFIMIGHILFGSDIEQFNSITHSVNTGITVLMGSFDWYVEVAETMNETGSLPSGMPIAVVFAWYCIYMFLVMLVLLNMLLAIIIEHYQIAKGRIELETPTLLEQVRRYFKFKRETRGHISLETLRQKLEDDGNPAHPEEEVTESSLMDAFPGMGVNQAMWLIRLLVMQLHLAKSHELEYYDESYHDPELAEILDTAKYKLDLVENIGTTLTALFPSDPGASLPVMWDALQKLVSTVDTVRCEQATLTSKLRGEASQEAGDTVKQKRERRDKTRARGSQRSEPKRGS